MPISEHRSAFFVACILMHDEFPTAHNVAHGLIKHHAVPQVHRMPPLAQTPHQTSFSTSTIPDFVQQVARYGGYMK